MIKHQCFLFCIRFNEKFESVKLFDSILSVLVFGRFKVCALLNKNTSAFRKEFLN